MVVPWPTAGGCRVSALRVGLIEFAQSNADWLVKAERAEQRGFDVLWTGDHLFNFRRPDEPMLDGWVSLSAWAATTTRIRLGMLITNLAWRSPVLVARSSVAVDQVSGGRLELGIGAGAYGDQAMAGVLDMLPGERIARLDEGAGVIDRLLRGDMTPFAGRFTRYEAAGTAPGCVQQPRPPITIAANGDRALRVVAAHADTWNTFGDPDLAPEEFLAATLDRSRRLDVYCAEIGRDPATVRRSLIVYPPHVDAWAAPDTVEELVERFQKAGFTEFVFYWPTTEPQVPIFDHFVNTVMPSMQTRATTPPPS
jgi:alkanesulfonate monooxygenase SsuD/methylene tetrahydromethanopterin reductase-like flavin-dependent oxidoreductase (luciferase family)